MSNESKEPAFPVKLQTGWLSDSEPDFRHFAGLTKREYFAGLAMMGYCANPALLQNTAAERALFARVDADALLAALEHPRD